MFFKYFRYLNIIPRVINNESWIKKYSKDPSKYDLHLRYSKVHKFIFNCCKTLKCEFIVEGLEKFPTDTNVLITPNHQSFIDPLTLLANVSSPITFVAKKETEQFPVVGDVIKAIEGRFMDRSSLKNEVRIMMAISKDLEEKPDQSIIIFPEGTRSKDTENRGLSEFKPGALKPAYNACKPIVPVAMYGSFRVLSTDQPSLKKYPIQLKILDPIPYEEFSKYSTVDFAKILHDKIEKEVDILREKDKRLVFKCSSRRQRKKIIREQKAKMKK